jgi:hypothetical protein
LSERERKKERKRKRKRKRKRNVGLDCVCRWLHQANPELSALITTYLRTDEWKSNLSLLAGLRQFADDEKFQKKWAAIKRRNKVLFSLSLFLFLSLQ